MSKRKLTHENSLTQNVFFISASPERFVAVLVGTLLVWTVLVGTTLVGTTFVRTALDVIADFGNTNAS